MKDIIDASSTDFCVICGADTKIPVDMPIACRRGYVVGCGQLCEHCSGEINFERVHKEETLNAADLQALLITTKEDD